LDADSSIQRVDASNRVADLKFPTGFGNVNDMSCCRTIREPSLHCPYRAGGVRRWRAAFQHRRPTEYNQPYFLALASPSNCYSTYPTGFRRIAIDTNGATLLTDTRDTVVTYPDWKLNMALAVSFTPGGRVFDPAAGTHRHGPYSGLVARMKPIGGSFISPAEAQPGPFPR